MASGPKAHQSTGVRQLRVVRARREQLVRQRQAFVVRQRDHEIALRARVIGMNLEKLPERSDQRRRRVGAQLVGRFRRDRSQRAGRRGRWWWRRRAEGERRRSVQPDGLEIRGRAIDLHRLDVRVERTGVILRGEPLVRTREPLARLGSQLRTRGDENDQCRRGDQHSHRVVPHAPIIRRRQNPPLRDYADIPYSYLHMRKSIFAALLCALLLAPALFAGPEIPFSSAARQRAVFAQRGPRIATDGTNFLVAWYDDRLPDVPLYVTLVGPDGKPLRSGPIRLPNAAVDVSGHYLVTWTGEVYLVFWMDYGNRTLKWVRVDRDGRVLDDQPRAIAGITTPHNAATIDGRTLVTFTGDHPETRLYGQFIDAHGTAAGARLTFPHAGRSDWWPQVVTNGETFYVVWTRFRGTRNDIVGITVSRDGQLGTERVIGPGDGIALASNGETYLLTYGINGNENAIVAEQLDATGATLTRTVYPTTRSYAAAALAPSGSGYLLATLDQNGAEVRVLDATGRETGRMPLAANHLSTTTLALASHATATIAVWNEDSDLLPSGSDVFATVVDAQQERVLMSEAAARQTSLRVATDGNAFLGAWLETRERPELRAGRISASGAPLDGEGIVIAEHVDEPPALIFDGANYVLAWIEKKPSGVCTVRAARITREGLNLDGSGRLLSQTCANSIALGTNGSESLFVRDETTSSKLLAHRLERDLAMGDAIQLPSRFGARDIAIAALDDMWLVAWTRYEEMNMGSPPMPPTYDIEAVRVSRELAILDGGGLQLTASEQNRAPSVAAAGNEFLVAWEHMTDDTILARRIPRFGAPLDEHIVTAGRAPSVVARGESFVIGVEDDGDLFAKTLGMPGRTPIATSADREHSVRLVNGANGLTAAYLRVANEPLYDFVDRAFLRMLDSTPRRRAIRK